MKTIKRILSALLAVLSAFSLCSCGSKAPRNEVNSVEDVSGRTIGAVRGTVAAYYAGKEGEARLYDSAEAMLSELKLGALDCAIYDNGGMSKSITGRGVRALDEPYCVHDLSMITARENADLMEDLNYALGILSDAGTLEKIVAAYKKGKAPYYTPREDVVRDRATLRIAFRDDIYPYCGRDENGELCGIDVEVAAAVSDILGLELIPQTAPAEELVTLVWYGKADIAMGDLSFTEEDGEKVLFSDPYASHTQSVLVRKR